MYQQITIIGNLGADPETRSLRSGQAVCNFRLAAGEKWKDKDGQQQEHTEWFRCAAWGRLGEIVQQYASKGTRVFVQGRLRTSEYTDNDGVERRSTEVVVDTFRLIEPRGNGNGRSGGGQTSGGSQGGGGGSRYGSPGSGSTGGNQGQGGGGDSWDDDIPF